ncbi:MAG: TonB-dependent siderophore receptor, partial [Pseudoxanthomonas sp.]|nr:TonB-dependent siderophore receptor [Pseudoxanthomonas sp.]
MSHSNRPLAHPRRTALSLLLPALLLAGAAQAQATPDGASEVTELDAVQVNAYRVTTHSSGATKTDTPIAEIPRSISVIAREELDARGAINLNEAMRYVAGVVLESTGQDNRYDDFRIRGFSAGSESGAMTVDGLRAPPPGSAWNRGKIDTWNLDRVEVLKGPSAVMYGQVAPGGLVNQVSKTPEPGQRQVLQLGVDGHGTWSSAFDVGAGTGDDRHLFRLVGRYADGGTQIDTVEQQHWFLAPSYTFQVADKTRLTLLGYYQEDDGGSTYQFLPMDGTLVPTRYGYMDNSTFIGEPEWNTWDATVWHAGWLLEHAFNDSWTFSQSARHMHVDSLYRAIVTNQGLLPDGRTQQRRQVMGLGDADTDGIDNRLVGTFSTGAADHTLLSGVDWRSGDWSADRHQGPRALPSDPRNPRPIDIFNPVHTGLPAGFPNSIGLGGGKSTQTGVYVQDQIALDKWRFTLGGRYDWYKDESWSQACSGTGTCQPRSATTTLKNEAFSGNAGALYMFDSGFSPYLSYAESFEPSTRTALDSYDGHAFDPTRGKQWEVGVNYQPASFDGLVTLAAYDLRKKDDAIVDTDHDNVCGANGAGTCYISAGETRVRGVELEARVTPVQGFSVIGAASHMDSELVRSGTAWEGKALAMVPDWMASLWADYTFQSGPMKGFSFASGVRHNGATLLVVSGIGIAGSGYPEKIPAYTLWDAAIRFDLSQVSQ